MPLLLLVACTGAADAPEPEASRPPRGGDAELAATLVALGDEAWQRGDAPAARERYRRAVAADPASPDARVGLARLDLAEGDLAGAEQQLRAAVAADPDSAAAHRGLGALARARGERAAARTAYERALALEPRSPEAHAGLAAVSGRAPPQEPGGGAGGLEAWLERARRHPYDPRARLDAGRALVDAGRGAEAGPLLTGALFAADVDPAAARAAAALLREQEPAWARRRTVPVHVRVDETLRRDPAWPMQARLLLDGLSGELAPWMDVVFYPASLGGFDTGNASDDLASLDRRFRSQAPSPRHGIVAGLTARPVPRARGSWRRGQAEFLGRRTLLRVQPGETESRVLVHEVLHLYGGVHVVDEVDSVMNPDGKGRAVDPLNRRIVRSLRERRFVPGGIERGVLPFIDEQRTTAAYVQVLRTNLVFRRLGLAEAVEAGRLSRYEAARQARDSMALDEHLGDVALFTGRLLLRQQRRAEAVMMLDVASRLYGPRSLRGRSARAEADRVLRASRPSGT